MKRSLARHLAGALLGLAVLGAAGGAAATGRVEVRYATAERFTDAGFGARELERTQRVLSNHLARLAAQLPDGQLLKVEVRDIDLAGELESVAFDRVRVLGRAPDRPRLDLRFELQADGRVLDQGEAVLTDLAYLERSVGPQRGEPLSHERRLLDEWFAERIAPAGAK
jgi:hypothetical protein